MNTKDIEILEAQDAKTLAKWWCVLNSWGWPKKLPNPDYRKVYESASRRLEIMGWIYKRIGFKECLREWNRDTMTDREFEQWASNMALGE